MFLSKLILAIIKVFTTIINANRKSPKQIFCSMTYTKPGTVKYCLDKIKE